MAVVGKEHDFTIYDDEKVDPFLAGEERQGGQGGLPLQAAGRKVGDICHPDCH